jgi:hypothetical protein
MMQMSHPWMYGDRCAAAYREGVHSFRDAAEANKHGGGFMFCPCVECRNEKDHTSSVTKAIGNNEERIEITARRHKILTWKALSNKER